MKERDKKAFEEIINRIRNMTPKDVDKLNERIRSSLETMETKEGVRWLTCEEFDKLKEDEKRVNEKDEYFTCSRNY